MQAFRSSNMTTYVDQLKDATLPIFVRPHNPRHKWNGTPKNPCAYCRSTTEVVRDLIILAPMISCPDKGHECRNFPCYPGRCNPAALPLQSIIICKQYISRATIHERIASFSPIGRADSGIEMFLVDGPHHALSADERACIVHE